MASTIRIKRSGTAGNPTVLAAGELAYSAQTGTQANGGDRLYIGFGTETAGDAANHFVIGGKYFTDLLDHVHGTLTASSALIVDANSKLDNLKVDNLDLNGNTISSTDTNGNIVLDPNGTGYVSLVGTNGVVIPVGTTAQRGPTVQGTIRYNTDLSSFEGYSGTVWGSLGGVKSVDGLTYISAELNPGDSDDTLRFYTNNVLAASLSTTLFRIGSQIATTQLDATTASTTTTSGALTVAGGVGIGGALNVAGNVTAANISSSGTISMGNISISGNTIASSNTNGDINLTPNGTGKVVLTNPYVGADTLAEYIYDTVGGAVTGGTGITVTNSDVGNTSTIAIDSTVVTLTGTQTLTNKTLTTPAIGSGGFTVAGSASGTTTVVATAAASGTLTLPAATDTLVGRATTDTLTNKTINLTSNTLVATSAQIAAAVTDETGSGALVFATSPTLVTPTLGVATATTINGLTITSTTGTLTIANGKTLTASNTLTFTGTDASSVAFGSGGTVAYTGNNLSVFAATTSAQLAGVISDETGSGALVFANSPTLVTPTLGAATATSITGASGNLSITAAAGNNNVNLVPTGTGTVDVANKRITSLAEPTQATDAATKNYVDAVKTGLDPKDSVRVATTAALTATYANGSSGVGATLTNSGTQAAITIDSIALSLNDRVLVKNQASALQNGIYTVTTVGTVSTNWVLTRATDADTATELNSGAFTFVEEGTTNGDNGFVCTTNAPITIGTTAIDWVQFSGAGQVIAGAGLTKTGNQLDVVGTADRITANADSIDIASTYVGQTSITTLGTIATGTWNATTIAANRGGTGVANAAGSTITLGGALSFSGAFTTAFTVTANTTLTLPTSGTLATLAGTETLTNKTLTSPTINGGALSGTFSGSTTLSGVITFSNATNSTSSTTGAVIVTGGIGVGGDIIGAGAATSDLDGFNIDGGTY